METYLDRALAAIDASWYAPGQILGEVEADPLAEFVRLELRDVYDPQGTERENAEAFAQALEGAIQDLRDAIRALPEPAPAPGEVCGVRAERMEEIRNSGPLREGWGMWAPDSPVGDAPDGTPRYQWFRYIRGVPVTVLGTESEAEKAFREKILNGEVVSAP